MVNVQSTILDPGGLMAKMQAKRAESEEQTCHSAREKGEAIKTSNWVFGEDLYFYLLLFCYLSYFYVISIWILCQ